MGETTFHVCFLMGSPTHMYCAKRILKWYPKLLHDIYLSEVLAQVLGGAAWLATHIC